MPLTKEGEKVLRSMKEQYGAKKGKSVFYASINKGKAGSEDWHESSNPGPDRKKSSSSRSRKRKRSWD